MIMSLRLGRLLLLALLVPSALSLTACTHVAAYQRGRLAHPTMAADDASSAAAEHVYAVHEGAMGGSVGATSGCGCN